MSVFASAHLDNSASAIFWQEKNSLVTKVLLQPVLLRQTLDFQYESLSPEPHELSLTPTSLYFLMPSQSVVVAKIKWCLIEPFSESNSSGDVRHGFSVISKFTKQDFYTKSSNELDFWLNQLSYISIMTDFYSNFVKVKQIDSGQSSIVYLCQDRFTHDYFAVKSVKKSLLASGKSLGFFYNEVKILRKVDHPNIVKLHKVYEDEECVNLVLEYVTYGNLLNKIKIFKQFEEKEVVSFTKNLLEVSVYLHKKGIIHRDIKPENILMTSEHTITGFKLADFGLACFQDTYDKSCSGSPGYMAPEILRGSSYSSKVDIFSIGILSYILISGVSPFSGNSAQKIIEKNIRCRINYVMPIFHSISVAGLEFLQEALDGDPTLRPTAECALRNNWFKSRKLSDNELMTSSGKHESTKDLDFLHFTRVANGCIRVNF